MDDSISYEQLREVFVQWSRMSDEADVVIEPPEDHETYADSCIEFVKYVVSVVLGGGE